MPGKIYLFPSFLAPVEPDKVLPRENTELLKNIKYFVVEELRTARRFLKACDRSIEIDSLHFEVLNEHTAPEAVDAMLAPALAGHDMGIISEAGCPAVADPGADLVAVAQRKGIRVVPLVGPSSILMSLMASTARVSRFSAICQWMAANVPQSSSKCSATLRRTVRRRYLLKRLTATTALLASCVQPCRRICCYALQPTSPALPNLS